MKLIKLVPDDTNIGFLKWRVPFFVVSGILIAASWALVLFQGLNLGVDFVGGQMIRTTFVGQAEAPVPEMRETIAPVNAQIEKSVGPDLWNAVQTQLKDIRQKS